MQLLKCTYRYILTVKRATKKHATCLATLLQNELNSDVARFARPYQTYLATNEGMAK